MDMTLYALLMRKLQGQEECLTWNGNGVEVVDAIPESPLPNTIYFVKSDILANTKVPTEGESVAPENLESGEVAVACMSMDADVAESESKSKKKTSKRRARAKLGSDS